MNIFEALGVIFIVLTSCMGTALTGWLIYQGLYRVGERILRGAEFEEKALKDYLPGIRVQQ